MLATICRAPQGLKLSFRSQEMPPNLNPQGEVSFLKTLLNVVRQIFTPLAKMPESILLFIGIVTCVVTIAEAEHDCTSFMPGKISVCINLNSKRL